MYSDIWILFWVAGVFWNVCTLCSGLILVYGGKQNQVLIPAKTCAIMFLKGSEKEYQLWVNSGKDDAPYPLIGEFLEG